ncbi:MAG TPA: hypothetical protein DDW52_20315 [Planctomycetaceae bacterium]|nr:hypothetical protein [Planctomycetaceae bacterium]
MIRLWCCLVLAGLCASSCAGPVRAEEVADQSPSSGDAKVQLVPGDAKLGYQLLTTKAYLPPVFTQANMDEIWRAWPKELRERAATVDPETRRRIIFERYGFTERIGFDSGAPDGSGKPLQYVVDESGRWSMNCLACHGGSVMGRSYPGAPNNRFAFELLATEMRNSKLIRGKLPNQFDVGATLMPLGKTRGTTNAIMFGVGLMHYRDEDLNLNGKLVPPAFVHHDVDAPPWWHFKKKSRLYIDGFAQKGHRGLLQFVMVEENSGEQLRSWEQDFQHIYAYLNSIEAPKYPFKIDMEKAKLGAKVFQSHCAECHGTYKTVASLHKFESYSEYRVAIERVGTDPVRLEALRPDGRAKYGRGWLSHYGREETIMEPDGYVAPPLDGVWASPPYFHNGSVPTLWGVLNPKLRPTVWKHRIVLDGVADENFDRREVGILYDRVTGEVGQNAEPQEVFNTEKFGKSNQGHTFPEVLTLDEKRQVLEYLKTL